MSEVSPEPCSTCGASWVACNTSLRKSRRPCCATCADTATHRQFDPPRIAKLPPYSDPQFVPGMVVCAADREPDDMRTWRTCSWTRKEPFRFVQSWNDGNITERRPDLPVRLAVVGGDGKVKP